MDNYDLPRVDSLSAEIDELKEKNRSLARDTEVIEKEVPLGGTKSLFLAGSYRANDCSKNSEPRSDDRADLKRDNGSREKNCLYRVSRGA